jgi:hypothetical protein
MYIKGGIVRASEGEDERKQFRREATDGRKRGAPKASTMAKARHFLFEGSDEYHGTL